jgi:hypothetical protein
VPYRATLARDFPDAVSYERYLARVEHAVLPLGFDREHSFAAVSVCRDELAQPLLHAVTRRWDQPFNLGGLGAVPSLGRTGWRAALSHVPDDSRGRLIVFGFPHIGIDPEGHVGESLRRHQHRVTPTCGAMVSLLDSLGRPAEPLPPGLDDREAERLRTVIAEHAERLPEDLLELTRLAARAVETEMWAELDALEAHRDMDIVVLCGIQIHLPDEVDHILPTASAFQGIGGQREHLAI